MLARSALDTALQPCVAFAEALTARVMGVFNLAEHTVWRTIGQIGLFLDGFTGR